MDRRKNLRPKGRDDADRARTVSFCRWRNVSLTPQPFSPLPMLERDEFGEIILQHAVFMNSLESRVGVKCWAALPMVWAFGVRSVALGWLFVEPQRLRGLIRFRLSESRWLAPYLHHWRCIRCMTSRCHIPVLRHEATASQKRTS